MLKMGAVVSSAPGNAVHSTDFIQSPLNIVHMHDFVCECVKGGYQSDRKKKGKSQPTETNVLTF